MSYVAGASLGNGQVRTFHFKRSWMAGANIYGEEGEGLGQALLLSYNRNRLTVMGGHSHMSVVISHPICYKFDAMGCDW